MRPVSTLRATLPTLAIAAISLACCMLPNDFDGRIGQNRQQALLIHDGDREELVLRIAYEVRGQDGTEQKAPPYFAWVVTVPQEPDAYAVADAQIFDDLKRLTRAHLRPKVRSLAKGNLATGGVTPLATPELEFGKRVQVGPYDIQPVRARGVAALTALNEWLKANGFPTEDPGHMKYFVDNGFTFLAIKVTPAEDSQLGASDTLQPLQLSFASTHPYYPLRFSSRQGVFDLDLWTLTKQPFDYQANKQILGQLNWSNQHYYRNHLLQEDQLGDKLSKALRDGRLTGGTAAWHFNYFNGHDVNKGETIATWQRDVFFDGGSLR